jgi:hypothetical protein
VNTASSNLTDMTARSDQEGLAQETWTERLPKGSGMLYWGYWIGPLIAVVLALWLRPRYLFLLGVIAGAGFVASLSTSLSLYEDCDPCPPTEHILVWVNTILFTIAPALVLLALLKHIFRGDSGFSAKPS